MYSLCKCSVFLKQLLATPESPETCSASLTVMILLLLTVFPHCRTQVGSSSFCFVADFSLLFSGVADQFPRVPDGLERQP
jgi:hypothetical protein